MFSFHKPKIYRSNSGCCICRAKSSSSRFTDSKKYEPEFEKCFRIDEKRSGEICNACVLLVKRWKKLPAGTNKNWHHVVDARAGPGTKSFKAKSSTTTSTNNNKNQSNKTSKNKDLTNEDTSSSSSSLDLSSTGRKRRITASNSSSSSTTSSAASSPASKVNNNRGGNNNKNKNNKMYRGNKSFRRSDSTTTSSSESDNDDSDDEDGDENNDDATIDEDMEDSTESNDNNSNNKNSINSSSSPSSGSSSLRRSTRLAHCGRTEKFYGNVQNVFRKNTRNNTNSDNNNTNNKSDNNNNTNPIKKNTESLAGRLKKLSKPKRYIAGQPHPYQLGSFIDHSFWKKEKICCGYIYKSPNNQILIHPKLLRPCCRNPSSSSNSFMNNKSSNIDAAKDQIEKTTTQADSIPPLINPSELTLIDDKSNGDTITDKTTPNKTLIVMPELVKLPPPSSSELIKSQSKIVDEPSMLVDVLSLVVNEQCDDNSIQDSLVSSDDRLSTVSSSLLDQDDGNLSSSSETFDDEQQSTTNLVKSSATRSHHHHSGGTPKTTPNQPMAVV